MSDPLVIAPEVREAIAAGDPVLALESTIFTHGLPRPRNVAVALEAEARVRALGVVPATIGIVDADPSSASRPTRSSASRRRKAS